MCVVGLALSCPCFVHSIVASNPSRLKVLHAVLYLPGSVTQHLAAYRFTYNVTGCVTLIPRHPNFLEIQSFFFVEVYDD